MIISSRYLFYGADLKTREWRKQRQGCSTSDADGVGEKTNTTTLQFTQDTIHANVYYVVLLLSIIPQLH
ncbi:hypothetical protein MAR_003490 [Mya arenaria]|uniref:Uncharacterized protein n=1 Tax=Mya arenaria TaxID=6604 RepID=A0ABY7G999_MYAAR|nr:hypothetical protein MAR_003490 [Mya arenaria]